MSQRKTEVRQVLAAKHVYETKTSLIPSSDVRVSALSVFSDEEWNFMIEIGYASQTKTSKVIRWKFQVAEGMNSLHPAYSEMLAALKQLAYRMLNQPKPLKCVYVVKV